MLHSSCSNLFISKNVSRLVTNGIFRGLGGLRYVKLMVLFDPFSISHRRYCVGDTRTPLKYSIMFTALNACLDPFFIFNCGFGASGAAAGTGELLMYFTNSFSLCRCFLTSTFVSTTAIAQYVALVPLLYR